MTDFKYLSAWAKTRILTFMVMVIITELFYGTTAEYRHWSEWPVYVWPISALIFAYQWERQYVLLLRWENMNRELLETNNVLLSIFSAEHGN